MNIRRLDYKSQQTLIPFLPEHLIIDHILPRLPGKSLITFKLVCKLWHSIISSIDFTKSHLKFSSLSPQFIVLTENDSVIDICPYKLWLLLNYDENNNNVRVDLHPNWVFTRLKLVGSCNGLICFYLKVDQYMTPSDEMGTAYFCVWNPVTRQCRKIMIPHDTFCATGYGFSYASSIDDYKIIASFNDGYLDEVYYFSLRSAQWKLIDLELIHFSDTLFYPALEFRDWKEDNRIVGFDLVGEKMKEIPYMDWLSRYKWVEPFTIKECVSFLCHGGDGDGSDIWVLKQYGDWNSWEKMYSFNFDGIVNFRNKTETGKFLFFCWGRLKVVDLSQKVSEVYIDFPDRFHGSGVYVESLISPFITSAKANQD